MELWRARLRQVLAELGSSASPKRGRPSCQSPQLWGSHRGVWQSSASLFSRRQLDPEPWALKEQLGRGEAPPPPCPWRDTGRAPRLSSQDGSVKSLDTGPPRTWSSVPRPEPGRVLGAGCCCGMGTGRASAPCPSAGCGAQGPRSSAPGCAPRTSPLSGSPARSATRAAGAAASSWPPRAPEGRGARRLPPAARPLEGDLSN